MTFYSVYVILLGACIFAPVGLIARLWVLRKRPGAYALMAMIGSLIEWCLAYVLEIAVPSLAGKILWSKMEFIGITMASPAVFTFVMSYSGRGRWVQGWRLLPLWVIPLATFLLALTNEQHHLMWTSMEILGGARFAPLAVTHGPWFTIHVVYAYTLLLAATVMLGVMVFRGRSLFRTQAALMLGGMLVPWAGNVIHILGLLPVPSLDLTPLAFTLTVGLITVAFARYKFADVLPVGQGSILNSMVDGVLVVDDRGRVTELNPAGERILGRSADELLGQDVSAVLPRWPEWARETPAGAESSRDLPLGEGEQERVYAVRVLAFKRGRSGAYLALFTDISDRRKAETRIQLQATALEAAENGILITDPQGIIEWCNPAFTRLSGYSREEAVGKSTRILKSGRHTPELYRQMWETIRRGSVWRGELCNRHKDGTQYFEELTITPLVRPDGTVSNFIAVKQNVSERHSAEEKLRAAHADSLEANRVKSSLLASVSHDLRNPLGGIMGYADMLHTGALGDLNREQRAAAADIIDCAGQLLSFVNNLIGQAQLETGRVVLRPTAFSPAEMVESVLGTTRHMAMKKGLSIEVLIDPSLPPRLVGDPYWLRQILFNLVSNAFRFTDSGGVSIRLAPDGGLGWRMQVSDTGPGIPPEDRVRIFEAFHQAGAAEGRGGSGLGLSIVGQLTALMKGTVELLSEVGRGTTFTVTFPAQSR